jgi:HNH endonuclease
MFYEINLYESRLVALGVNNVQFRKGKRLPIIDFDCNGKHVLCLYNPGYSDPRVWQNFQFGENLINRNTYEFTHNGEIIIRLYGPDIYECPALIAYTYEIVWTLLRLRIEVDLARDEMAALFSCCTTYKEVEEELRIRPQLCADAKQPKSTWPLIWGRIKRGRGSQDQKADEFAEVAAETTLGDPRPEQVASDPTFKGEYALGRALESPLYGAGGDETNAPEAGARVGPYEGENEPIDAFDRDPPETAELLDQVVGQGDVSRCCCICEETWTSGKVLIDGSVFHEHCWSELAANSQHLSLQRDAIVGELNKSTSLFGVLANWVSSGRKHRDDMLRAQLADLSSQIDSITEKLRGLYDVWPNYPPDWEQRRQFAIQRDGKTCAKCGVDERLHLHHKRAIREGGSHRLTNLVLLCEVCHSDAHGGTTFHYQEGNDNQTSVEKRIRLISEAIALGRDVHFRYEKYDGTITRRTVTPRELRKLSNSELKSLSGRDVIRKEGRLCMFGYCHLREADRVFAIDRIRGLRFE